MPRIEIELDDKGELLGDVPEGLSALFKRTESTAYGAGYGKGVEQAAKDAKKQIEDNVKAELLRRDAMAPMEREKYRGIEEENLTLKQRIAESMRDSDRTMKAREEAHARELVDRTERLKRRDEKIRDLVKARLSGLAITAGARDESLPELEIILGSAIGFDDEMEPYVRGEDGQPKTVHGKPMSLAAYVKDYLDTHPHHRKPPAGYGSGARGGATFQQYGRESTVSLDAAKQRINGGDRSPNAIDELFQATRKRQAG